MNTKVSAIIIRLQMKNIWYMAVENFFKSRSDIR